MKNFLILVAGLLLAHLGAAQNTFPVASIPKPLLKYADAVVRLDAGILKISSPRKATLENRMVVTFFKKTDNEKVHTMALTHGRFQKVRSMRAVLYDASGNKVYESSKSDVKEYGSADSYEFSDSRVKVLEVARLQTPYTLEYQYEIDYEGFFQIPAWTLQSVGQAVEHSEFTLACPADYTFYWRSLGAELQPERRPEGWRWAVDKLPAIPKEPAQPGFEGVCSQIVFAPDQFSIDNYSGSMRDWKSFGAFVYKLNEQRDLPSAELVEKVQRMTAGAQTEQEKIAILYRYLQENHRYVSVQIGIGGWQTFDAAYVEKKRYGDCKALSNYMRTLLRAAGIPAWMALVYGGREGAPELPEDFPVPAFNHAILYVPGTDTWLECTSNDLPMGYLSLFASNRQALLLTPEGGKLARTPVLDASTNTSYSAVSITLSENAPARIDARLLCSGALQEPLRDLASREKGEDLRRAFVSRSGLQLAGLGKLDISPAPTRPETRIEYQAEMANFANQTGKRMFVPLNKIESMAERNLPADTSRVQDVFFSSGKTVTDSASYLLPVGFIVENAPPEINLNSDYGAYRMKIVQEPGKVLVLRNLQLPRGLFPAARYEAIRQFYQQIGQADGKQMVLVKKDTVVTGRQ